MDAISAGSAMLDGAQPDHGQLLLGRLGLVEGRVVRLDHEQLGATVDRVAHQSVVGDLEADHIADRAGPTRSTPGRGPAMKSVGTRSTLVIRRGERADRHVLRERHGMPLDVASRRAR